MAFPDIPVLRLPIGEADTNMYDGYPTFHIPPLNQIVDLQSVPLVLAEAFSKTEFGIKMMGYPEPQARAAHQQTKDMIRQIATLYRFRFLQLIQDTPSQADTVEALKARQFNPRFTLACVDEGQEVLDTFGFEPGILDRGSLLMIFRLPTLLSSHYSYKDHKRASQNTTYGFGRNKKVLVSQLSDLFHNQLAFQSQVRGLEIARINAKGEHEDDFLLYGHYREGFYYLHRIKDDTNLLPIDTPRRI